MIAMVDHDVLSSDGRSPRRCRRRSGTAVAPKRYLQNGAGYILPRRTLQMSNELEKASCASPEPSQAAASPDGREQSRRPRIRRRGRRKRIATTAASCRARPAQGHRACRGTVGRSRGFLLVRLGKLGAVDAPPTCTNSAPARSGCSCNQQRAPGDGRRCRPPRRNMKSRCIGGPRPTWWSVSRQQTVAACADQELRRSRCNRDDRRTAPVQKVTGTAAAASASRRRRTGAPSQRDTTT